MPPGTRAVLDARSLAASHRRLAGQLRPGLAVLDVGCGTGAITRGIAEAVAPGGRAVGIDENADMIARALQAHAGVPGLAFALGDAYALPFDAAFDLVTAARVLQWLADPVGALRAMIRAVRPGGSLVVLDFNHEKIAWTPDPPASMRRFYAAFLAWRAGAGLDNAIADRLPALFEEAGLAGVVATTQHESRRRGEPVFEALAGIWTHVAATRGHQMVADGALTEAERAAAEAEYREWVGTGCAAHAQYLLAVEGVRPYTRAGA